MILFILLNFAEVVELYNMGNKFYAEGNFQSAIECYEKALTYCRDKDLYYNLGNAYFKAGKLGKAIIQYRRAYLLCPRDEDVFYNLNFVRSFRPDKLTTIPNPFVQFLDRFFHYFSITESALFSAIAFFFISIFLSLFLIFRRKVLLGLMILSSLCFFYFIITHTLWQSEKNSNSAVVITDELKAFSGPGEEYKEILVIHDGTEARIREERNGYYLIQLPGGIGGWVRTDGMERIFE
ncbi:MAG: tetratricopeptide repeat protein [candidate division WOR-3 bacterium]|nr:tetratricopeptide repeat protein [candidate division WOR-3 bacterium]